VWAKSLVAHHELSFFKSVSRQTFKNLKKRRKNKNENTPEILKHTGSFEKRQKRM